MATQKQKDYLFLYRSIAAGLVVAAIVYFGSWGVGQVSNWQGLSMLKAAQPTLRFLASTLMSCTATILALILTLLSFSSQKKKKFKSSHYTNLQRTVALCTITFVGSLILLMFLNIPLENTDDIIDQHFSIIYHVIQIYAALLGGMLMVIILLLYRSASNLIIMTHPDKNSDHLFVSEPEDEEED